MSSSFLKNTLSCLKKIVLLQALQGCLTLTAFASFHIAELPVNEKSGGITNPQDKILVTSKIANKDNAPIAVLTTPIAFPERIFVYEHSWERRGEDFGRGLLSWLTLGMIDLIGAIDPTKEVSFNKEKEKKELALNQYIRLVDEQNSLKFGMSKLFDKGVGRIEARKNFSLEVDDYPEWKNIISEILLVPLLYESNQSALVDFGDRADCLVSRTANFGQYEVKLNDKNEMFCEFVPHSKADMQKRVQGIIENIQGVKLNGPVKTMSPFYDGYDNDEDSPRNPSNLYYVATNLGIAHYNLATNRLFLYKPHNAAEILSVNLSNERAAGSVPTAYDGPLTLSYSTTEGFGFFSIMDTSSAPQLDAFTNGVGYTDITISADQKYKDGKRIHNGVIQFGNNKYLFEKVMNSAEPDGGWSLDRIDTDALGGSGYYSATNSRFKYFVTENKGLIQWNTLTNTFVPVLGKNCAQCPHPDISSIKGVFANDEKSFFIATNNGKYLLTETENRTNLVNFETRGVTLTSPDTLEWREGIEHGNSYVITTLNLLPGEHYTLSFETNGGQVDDEIVADLVSEKRTFARSVVKEEMANGFLKHRLSFIAPAESVIYLVLRPKDSLKEKMQVKNVILEGSPTMTIEKVSSEPVNYETTVAIDAEQNIRLVLTEDGMKAYETASPDGTTRRLLQGIPMKKASHSVDRKNSLLTLILYYEVRQGLVAAQRTTLPLPFQWTVFEEKIAQLDENIKKERTIASAQKNISVIASHNSPIKIAEIKGVYTANGLEKCPANTEWSTTQILPQYQLFDCRVVVKSIFDKEGNQYLPINSAKGYLVSHLFPDHVFSFRSNTGQWLHTSMKVSPQGIDIAYGASPATLLNTTGVPVKFKNFNAQSMTGAPSEYISSISFSKSGDVFQIKSPYDYEVSLGIREINQTYTFHKLAPEGFLDIFSAYPYEPSYTYALDAREYVLQGRQWTHADKVILKHGSGKIEILAPLTPEQELSSEQRKNRMTVSQNGTIFTIVNGPLLSVATTDFNTQTLRNEIKYSLQGLSAVNKMFTDANENLFIATNTGLIIGTPNAQKTEYSFKTLTTAEGLAANSVHTAAIANDGTLYLAYGNAGKGLSVGTPSKNQNGETSYSFKHYAKANSGSESGFLLAETVYALAVSSSGDLYIGYGPTGHGLTIASQNRENATFLPTHYRKELGNLPSNSIKDIKIDHFDQVFLIPIETNLTGLFALGINTTEPTQKWNGPASSFHKPTCNTTGCQ